MVHLSKSLQIFKDLEIFKSEYKNSELSLLLTTSTQKRLESILNHYDKLLKYLDDEYKLLFSYNGRSRLHIFNLCAHNYAICGEYINRHYHINDYDIKYKPICKKCEKKLMSRP